MSPKKRRRKKVLCLLFASLHRFVCDVIQTSLLDKIICFENQEGSLLEMTIANGLWLRLKSGLDSFFLSLLYVLFGLAS